MLNPFNASSTSVIDSFIERMLQSFKDFQWMNAWPGQDNTRGNMVYANLHKRPEELEKTSFIALGSLRSYPNQQFRKLQCALLDDVLPWSLSCVETIVRQTFYQISDLTEEEDPEMLWKADMLHANCEIVCENGTTLGYKFTVGKQGERLPDRIAALRQKECVLYGYALLSYPLGPLDDHAAQELCELMVLFRTCFLCASINSPSTEKMLQVERNVYEMMSRRIETLASFVKKDTDKVLTSLVHLVSATSPEQLEWKEIEELSRSDEQFGCCFESADS
ncbi:hypothetical protein Pcac1_g8575 [Phytophthora cactorum]|uniref:Uncharacterized protein n=1 Tax=Phytophthora cactorum TaxID=29920 RepID=A0A329SKT7_9STRA|nr:hypothetical protein Pcac1_g8575 [Phytophthora cactorum]KAG2849417.1 hypothetical protein PC112_g275 [Phytophthora cactorum]KAG3206832.1 hypothetical protein PC128_g465 [Phytophthora cactorum]RAW36192.1 hypothetical protein PC110_g7523 [Phytophthora cactorum]